MSFTVHSNITAVYWFQTRQNRVRTSVRAGPDRTVRVTAGWDRRAKARRTANRPASERCSTRSSCTRCGRATRLTRGRTPSWKSNWSRWPDLARGSYVCGFKINGAKTRSAPSHSNNKYNKTKYVHTILRISWRLVLILCSHY